MWDVRVKELAGRQRNRLARGQLVELGMSIDAIELRVAARELVPVLDGVYALAPLLDYDEWGKWMGATLTQKHSVLSHESAAAAYGFWSLPRRLETITRPGSGGPRRHGGVLAYRSSTLRGDTTEFEGIPITTVPRILLDLARGRSDRALARSVRDAVRLNRTTLTAIGDALGRHRGRRGAARLATVVARYSGLPLERARSGAEVRAMEVLREAGRSLPRLNVRVAGEEADLSWPNQRLIIEIDGDPFHLDLGEDARKEAAWRDAGWTVKRLPSDHVYEQPARLLRLAPP